MATEAADKKRAEVGWDRSSWNAGPVLAIEGAGSGTYIILGEGGGKEALVDKRSRIDLVGHWSTSQRMLQKNMGSASKVTTKKAISMMGTQVKSNKRK